ncbi:hypothetical protein [Streptomyces caelestis]|uniref:Translation initiation factor 2 n=1 Tax=Streptomyces caelestis TaxID=36816 RepID=A0A7W9LWH6_9ACTN|nr:hypothetical protein [Streptomyces caelestis]MBB5798659.1 hypothetical protein [Streptomyces caelestis]
MPKAVVAGDPCIDQLRASLPFRESYRQAFGLLPGQRLVVVSSTWGSGSVLGSPRADVLRRVLAELPTEEFRVLAAIHPNSWHGHGSWQLHSWLAPFLDSGLLLPVPESDTWKAALCSADFLLGDHGSLTMYGIALEIPCILGAFDESKVAPGSPMARLGRILPRLTADRPLLCQLAALDGQRDDPELQAVGETVTSEPGRSAELLRRLFYTWLRLDEPGHPASVSAIPVPSPPSGPGARRVPHEAPMFVTACVTDDGTGAADGEVVVRRYPAARQHGHGPHIASAHLAADRDDPDRRWPRTADVLLVPRGRTAARPEDDPWCAYAAESSGCGLLAAETEEDGCLALLPDGGRVRVSWRERPAWAAFPLAASAVYAWTVRERAAGTARARPTRSERIVVRAGDLPDPGQLDLAYV